MRNPHILEQVVLLKKFTVLTDAERAYLDSEFKRMTLLTPAAANAKTAKNEGRGVLSYILHFAPADVSGFNVCPAASIGCKAACLNTAGRGRFNDTQYARIRKTLFYIHKQDAFLNKLWTELTSAQAKADKLGVKAVVRLNGTSDIAWENRRVNGLNPFEAFPRMQFYDYTKLVHRLESLKTANIKNYYLIFSASETNAAECTRAIQLGYNVAMVFNRIPKLYQGVKVVDGDKHDLRFRDRVRGRIVALKAKGRAKADKTGFVRQVA